MKPLLKGLLAFVVALILGLGSAVAVVVHLPKNLTVNNGPWQTNLAVGSAQSGMYMRATVALAGLFALNKSETIYFLARTDDDGLPLRSRCEYIVEGGDLNARWWSITLYGWDCYLIPNEAGRHSYNGKNIGRETDDRFRIHVSSASKEGNWLPSGDQRRMYLTLRLYNPAPEVYQNPGTVALPSIKRVRCP